MSTYIGFRHCSNSYAIDCEFCRKNYIFKCIFIDFVLCVHLLQKLFLKYQLVHWYNWYHSQHQWWRLHHMCHMCDSTYGYICYWIYGWTWVIWHLYLMNAFIAYTSSTWLLVFHGVKGSKSWFCTRTKFGFSHLIHIHIQKKLCSTSLGLNHLLKYVLPLFIYLLDLFSMSSILVG